MARMTTDPTRRTTRRDRSTDPIAMAQRTDLRPVHRAAAILHTFDVDRRVVEGGTRLSAADLRLLWLLSDGLGRTQREISSELSLEQSTVNRQVNAALRAGHIVREAGESGAAVLSATAEGLQRYAEDVEALMSVMDAALTQLGGEQEHFLVLLATFVAAYREAANEQHR